jgi:phosphohistidine phosphatase
MQLYIMRHAIAALREKWIGPDADRPLTLAGRARMRQAARGLRAMRVRFDLIVSSPLVRALQTAEVVSREIKAKPEIEICPALSPGLQTDELFRFLATFPKANRVLLVGHEPDLGNLVLTLIGGGHPDSYPMRKGAVCRVDIDSMPPGGPGRLIWAVSPRILRGLAR